MKLVNYTVMFADDPKVEPMNCDIVGLSFSISKDTSAKPCFERLSFPSEIICDIESDLKILGFCSPKTQRKASKIFVLPHPFGPTMAEILESNSTNDFS